MTELRVELSDEYQAMLRSLQPVAERVMEESLDWDAYVNLVIWRGLRAMIEDIVPI